MRSRVAVDAVAPRPLAAMTSGSTITGMPRRVAAVRSAVMFSMHWRRSVVGARDVEEVHAHARRVEAHGVADRDRRSRG